MVADALIYVWGVIGFAAPLIAQVPNAPGPPPETNPWPAYMIGAAITTLIFLAAWKGSKRTHQD